MYTIRALGWHAVSRSALSIAILQNKCILETETNRFRVSLICCLWHERLALCRGCSHLTTLPRHLKSPCSVTDHPPPLLTSSVSIKRHRGRPRMMRWHAWKDTRAFSLKWSVSPFLQFTYPGLPKGIDCAVSLRCGPACLCNIKAYPSRRVPARSCSVTRALCLSLSHTHT
jgi:hypothetical protein